MHKPLKFRSQSPTLAPELGKEVVQVYAIDDNSSVVTPNQELIAFTKVEVA